ncbi:tetratricopeptide repeat protein [Polyangium sp. 15x6]|uniref:tetratricopeptide repeat protein n=1 Tax=Polyangium sp. 15x6 TaxID=3042687 RepID=UPI00249A2150|nr:tetratricopeptide repeat protein [Polyangium sp. 15x6]MDI3288339.1 tetratricopeptide repeat protein [Polyangium sp. 15x6]
MTKALATHALPARVLLLLSCSLGASSCGGSAPSPSTSPVTSSPPAPAVDPRLAMAAEYEATARRAIAAGQLAAASEAAWGAARTRTDMFGPTHAEVERALLLCAWIDERRGALDGALSALRGAGYATTARLGPRSLDAATLLDRIARIEAERLRLDDARSAAAEALAMREALLGPSHPDVARTLVLVGEIDSKQCRATEAVGQLRRALAIVDATPKVDPLLVVDVLDKLGTAQWISRSDGEAEALWKRALGILAPLEATEYARIIAIQKQLATHAAGRGDRASARAWAEQAFAVAERHVGANAADPRVGPGMLLADHLREGGDPAGAEAMYARIGRKERTWGTSLPTAATKSEAPRCIAPSKSGNVSNAAQVVAGMAPGFRRCYNAILRQSSAYKTSMRLAAKIGPGGEVTSVRTVVSVHDPDSMIDCLFKAVTSTKFDPPEGGGATVVIPIMFVSQ